jgi:hypothetical protein
MTQLYNNPQMQVCMIVTPHSTDIKGIIGESFCPGAAPSGALPIVAFTATATQITVTYGAAVTGNQASHWIVKVNGGASAIISAPSSGNNVNITHITTVTPGDTVTVSYDGNPAYQSGGQPLAAITDYAVTNNT